MLAYVVTEPGVAGLRRVPVPVPGQGELLLRVTATALNRKDLFLRDGLRGPGMRPVHYPLVPGAEVVGAVVAAGPGVPPPAAPCEGDLVLVDPALSCGSCRWCRSGESSRCRDYGNYGEQCWGGLAEYVVASATGVRSLPLGSDPLTVVAAPVAFSTAWRALMTAGGLRAGEQVLVTGIGGGVAGAGLQVALLAGATVLVTSSSPDKIARAVGLGAAGGVDHSREDVNAWVRGRPGVRVSTSCSTAPAPPAGARASQPWPPAGGCASTAPRPATRPSISIRELYQSHRSIIGAPMGGRADLDRVWDLVTAGRLSPVVDSVHPLDRVEDALARLAGPTRFGKVVVHP